MVQTVRTERTVRRRRRTVRRERTVRRKRTVRRRKDYEEGGPREGSTVRGRSEVMVCFCPRRCSTKVCSVVYL